MGIITSDEIAAKVVERLHQLGGVIAPRVMTIEKAAMYLGLTVPALRTKVSRKQIPYVQDGRIKRFVKDDLDAWIEEHKVRKDDAA